MIRVPHGHLQFDDFFYKKLDDFQELLIFINGFIRP